MPIYEYQCQTCQHIFEVMQKMSDKPITKCPECHGKKVNRLISPSGFHLKGTGWYATDYKKPASQPAAKEETTQANKNETASKPKESDKSKDS